MLNAYRPLLADERLLHTSRYVQVYVYVVVDVVRVAFDTLHQGFEACLFVICLLLKLTCVCVRYVFWFLSQASDIYF